MAMTRHNPTNDDGTGTTGTVADLAWYTQLCDDIDAALAGVGGATEVTTTATGTQNNLSLGTTAGVVLLRCNNASLLTITGIAALAGQRVFVVAVGAGNVELAHQSGSSTAANRFINYVASGNTPLAAGSGAAEYVYDDTTDRWRLVGHDQGGWITPTYAGGTYTASGTMTWTVDSGDVTTYIYRVDGRALQIKLVLSTTSVGGTLSSQLQVALPHGFTAAVSLTNETYVRNDNFAGNGVSIWQITVGANLLRFFTDFAGNNWSTSTNQTQIFYSGTVPLN